MIISENRIPSLPEFKTLVLDATIKLNDDAKRREAYYLKRNAQLLEDDVARALSESAIGTAFADTIRKISGQCFPDIVAASYYGVEVKSSKDDRWITLGGSVNESTRIEGVERIFLTFGKLLNPVEFRSRPYEDCLSDVVVTHYPRYRIDMNLSKGKTIFDKMDTTYDALRQSTDPVVKIVDYYKSRLGEGESLWWTGSATQTEQPASVPMKIRLWRTLSAEEKKELSNIGLALFPDLLSNSSTKYEGFSLWLVGTYGVISTSVRDSFSAGGQGTIRTDVGIFDKVPHVLLNIQKNSTQIALNILNADESVLEETWRTNKISSDRIGQWIEIVSMLCSLQNHSIHTVLNAIFGR
ncbi:hypothetical protein FACS1894111_08400 [Clostridia bacterium]|nr:hypothetical protein FACS1894111_08400 [Clostridia bacterium]